MALQKLPPEYNNAALVIDNILSSDNIIKVRDTLPKEYCFTTGDYIISSKDFKSKQIPAGHGWRWNQVKGRKKVWLSKSGFVGEFYKLMPRPISKNEPMKLSGQRKLWKFTVRQQNSAVLFRILWCEKGEMTMKIEDYAFLAPFVEPSLAKILWPGGPFC